MTAEPIAQKLVAQGYAALRRPPAPVDFVPLAEANTLLNDLEHHSHAFVLACLVDRQDTAERAWTLPYRLGERVGSWELADLAALPPEAIVKHVLVPDALHRFPAKMAPVVYAALKRIANRYDGDASRIWAGSPSSAAIVRRFLEFDGCGPKIATMAANILVRDFRIPVSDKYSIDVSVDVHVRRVMRRLGLVRTDCSDEEIIYRAREMNPKFPGVIDLGLWELGRSSCRPKSPTCEACNVEQLCPRIGVEVPS
jgi:Predicted EndoIII-related endonuclease